MPTRPLKSLRKLLSSHDNVTTPNYPTTVKVTDFVLLLLWQLMQPGENNFPKWSLVHFSPILMTVTVMRIFIKASDDILYLIV